jgi:ACT domain-containing protein
MKYDSNITTIIHQSGNSGTRSLCNIQFDDKKNDKLHWVEVLLVAKAEAELHDNTDLH